MTTHILIVDATTLPLHLEYLFAGTGARDAVVDFNDASATALKSAAENNLMGMIADGGRIRHGDDIIFYLQQNARMSILEGKFFGIFKARHDGIFLDNNDGGQYLKSELGKSLTFRTLLEPGTVYAEGVTEWEALDEIRNIASPHQMLWSLIYRKLKGNRGNTMITLYEAERLAYLIRNKNNRRELDCRDASLSFDLASQTIVVRQSERPAYQGRQVALNVLPRLVAKYGRKLAFEANLQAYITNNLGRGIDADLDNTLLGGAPIGWLGNEVSCGVGMQRIDVMASVVRNCQRTLLPIELKSEQAKAENMAQIQRYVDWIEQYYIPNCPSDIQPMLIAQRTVTRTTAAFRSLIQAVANFNRTNANRTWPLRYVEFSINAGRLYFEEIDLTR